MPDLSKALGDVYGQAATKPSIGDRQIDDDLAAALSAALINAPAVPAVTVATGAFAGALRDLSSVGSPAETPPAPVAVAAATDTQLTPPAETPLAGPPWRREDDDILPGATKKASRGLHLGRR